MATARTSRASACAAARSTRRSRALLARWRGATCSIVTADHGCDPAIRHRPHARVRAAAGAPARCASARRWAPRAAATTGRSPTSARRVLDWLSGAQARALPGARLHSWARCPSSPRSRRSAASWRRWCRGGDAGARRGPRLALVRPLAPAELADALTGARWSAWAPRQVSGVELRATRSTWLSTCA